VLFIAKRRGCCCNLSVGVTLKMWLTTNGMCARSNTQIYVTRTSNNRVISLGDLYCCLLPQCEALRTCRSRFLIATQEIYFLSFTCAIHEYDQRWTCAWIWIQILWHFNILMDVDVTIFPDLDSNFQIWNGINDFL